MTDEMLAMPTTAINSASQTNSLANGLQVEVDEAFKEGGRKV